MLFSGCSSSNNFSDDMKNHHHQQFLLGDDQTKKHKKDNSISTSDPIKTLTKTTTGDGATIEVARRPRGRPPGSKNKPKPPLVITRDAEPPAAMRTHILEISTGHDIVDAIASFARRRSIGLCVLAGSGSVSNVTLRQPMQTPASAVVLRGRFEILSLSGSMLPPSLPTMQVGVSVSLAGPQGQVIGGMVAAPLLASGTVVVVAAGFENPSFNRLPEDNDGDQDTTTAAVNVSPGAEACEANTQTPHHHHHHHHHQHRHEHELNAPPADSCGMAMYSSDAIWAPTPRPPPPPPASRY